MKLKDPNFSPLESCWIIEKKKKKKAQSNFTIFRHTCRSVGGGRKGRKEKEWSLGWQGWCKNSLFETGYLGCRIWQIVLISKGTFRTSFLCYFPFQHKKTQPTLAFLQLKKKTKQIKSNHTKVQVSETRRVTFPRYLERRNERMRKEGRKAGKERRSPATLSSVPWKEWAPSPGARGTWSCHLLEWEGWGISSSQFSLVHPGQRQGYLKRETILVYLILPSFCDQKWSFLNSPTRESPVPDLGQPLWGACSSP